MTLNFDNYDVDIDVEATRRAHSRLPRTSEKCGCAGCRNFTLAIGDVLGEGGRRLFASVGVEDPAKATESCVDLPHGDGTFLYGAWYHLFGRIRRRFEAVPDATSAEWGEARERRVGERAHISFVDGRRIIGREAAFGDAAIVQMELSAEAVPWVLDGPNPYLDE